MAEPLRERLGLPTDGPLLIALVGGGGKTTTLLALAQEYKTLNLRVLVTTTTRIYLPPAAMTDSLWLPGESTDPHPVGRPGRITVAGAGIENGVKLVSLMPEMVDELLDSGGFDVILVEADGAKGKPIKAPDTYEPVIPSRTTHVIGVIGMDALGAPAETGTVHRLDRFLQVTGLTEGERIGPETLETLVESPEGLFKGTPADALRILLLNKAEAFGKTREAQQVIETLNRRGLSGLARGCWR